MLTKKSSCHRGLEPRSLGVLTIRDSGSSPEWHFDLYFDFLVSPVLCILGFRLMPSCAQPPLAKSWPEW